MSPEEQIAVVRTVIGGGESYYAELKSAWHYGPEGREMRDVLSVDGERSLQSLIGQWQQAGILQPAGPGRWKLGTSFLKSLSARCA